MITITVRLLVVGGRGCDKIQVYSSVSVNDSGVPCQTADDTRLALFADLQCLSMES